MARRDPLDYRVELDIQRFDGNLGGDVSLDGWWRLLGGTERPCSGQSGRAISESAGGGDYESLVLAESRTLEKLSREVAEAIKTLPK